MDLADSMMREEMTSSASPKHNVNKPEAPSPSATANETYAYISHFLVYLNPEWDWDKAAVQATKLPQIDNGRCLYWVSREEFIDYFGLDEGCAIYASLHDSGHGQVSCSLSLTPLSRDERMEGLS